MATQQRDKIEYDFEDLRRNTDPVAQTVLDQLGLDDEDLAEDEHQDDEPAKKAKAKDEEDADEELDADEEEEDDLDGEDLAADGEYKPEKMTGKMRKRLLSVKRDAQREIATAKAEAGEEISKLQKRVDELERTGKTDDLSNEFEEKIGDIESKIEAAMEEGDSKLVARLTREMSDATADMRDRKRKLESDHEEPDDLDKPAPKIIPRAAEWVREQDWWDDPEYGHIRSYVRDADIALQAKGYKPTDDDFYEHLETLVEKKYPGVVELTMSEDEDEEFDIDDDDEEFADIPSKKSRRAKKKKGRRRSPVSEGDRGGVARSRKKVRKKGARKLTAARVANMRAFGMDPENPEHVEGYFDNNPGIGE